MTCRSERSSLRMAKCAFASGRRPRMRSSSCSIKMPASRDRSKWVRSPTAGSSSVTGEARAGSRYRYRIDGKTEVPDPASRRNPDDIHGPSEVIDPAAFEWDDDAWRGRPWHEAVVYELHVGTFSPEGTFAGVETKLDHLVELGVTAIELMPIADFPGKRGWGYDGVLQFAPESAYGRPEELKSLIAAAHRRGLAVMLDVVYNHFGPEGNYLHVYAQEFFTDKHQTPWGAAINFDAPGARNVRDFFIHNTLYWLEEYRFDGLRFDAVHAIIDDSEPNILTEIARAARDGPGRERDIFLVLENGANQARFLGEPGAKDTFDAQWNDDVHHCLHTLLTGETDGYYEDYVENPYAMLCRCLAEGFGYQGQNSAHLGGAARRAQRTPAADRLRQLPAESRSDRQSRFRRADQRRRALGRSAARGLCRVASGALPADAVHGRGVGSAATLSVLLRFRAGPGGEGA